MKIWYTLCILFLLTPTYANAVNRKHHSCSCSVFHEGKRPELRCLNHYKQHCPEELDRYEAAQKRAWSEQRAVAAAAQKAYTIAQQEKLAMLDKNCSCSTLKNCTEPSNVEACYAYYGAHCMSEINACMTKETESWDADVKQCVTHCPTSEKVQLYNAGCPVCAAGETSSKPCLPNGMDAATCKQFYSLQQCQEECNNRHGIPVVSTYWSCLAAHGHAAFSNIDGFSACVERKF